MTIYDTEHLELQTQFESRDLAERMEEMIVHDEIQPAEKDFIEGLEYFFLSTITKDGEPTVSFKGGNRGFVRVIDPKTLIFPSYNGNGMFYSVGNLAKRPAVGILFIDFEHPHRIRFHGTAELTQDPGHLAQYPEAELVIRVNLTKMWVNCPRYIPKMEKVSSSDNVPREGHRTPLADWKRVNVFQDVLPDADRQRVETEGGALTPEEYAARISSLDT